MTTKIMITCAVGTGGRVGLSEKGRELHMMGSTKTVTNEVMQKVTEAGVGGARLEVGMAQLVSHRVAVHACDTCL